MRRMKRKTADCWLCISKIEDRMEFLLKVGGEGWQYLNGRVFFRGTGGGSSKLGLGEGSGTVLLASSF